MNQEMLMEAPFHLTEEEIRWVEETRSGMDETEKLQQLFCLVTYEDNDAAFRETCETIRPGGIMMRRMPTEALCHAVSSLQKYAKIPLLIAANLEEGGNGASTGGTVFGKEMAVAATGDAEEARRLGEVCGKEGSLLGINWAFAPVVDIDWNWRNPITNTRTFGSDPDLVEEMGRAYVEEVQKAGLAASAKHFPGDGRDERDQHVAFSVNDCTVEEWDATYGKIYRAMIEAGTKTVMIGHIMLPAYTRYFSPDTRDSELLPASLSEELIQKLLREKLGFRGLIVSDSTTMAGATAAMPREELVPRMVAAGCDMFLFAKSYPEDFSFMERGYRKGIITPERLDEAVTRILALKASLGLPEKQKNGTLCPDAQRAKNEVGGERFRCYARECAEKSITLVKEEAGVLPLSPEKYRRVLFYPLRTKSDGPTPFLNPDSAIDRLKDALREEGFDLTVFRPSEGYEGMMTPVSDFTDRYDLILYAAALATKSNQTVARIEWQNPMGVDVPIYTHTLPTVFVSLENPYHLADVPQVRTYINCYGGSEEVVHALVEKLCGRQPFLGKSPVDPFCGKWDARVNWGEKNRKRGQRDDTRRDF